MSIPLEFLNDLPDPSANSSLGDQLAAEVTDSGRVSTLLDCLSAIDRPALFSPDMTRPPLTHTELHHFISHFALPTSGLHPRLGPNDRIMIALPTGPENALALMAIASYHTGAPVNYSCTASELSEDAARLKAKAVVTTIEAAERLELKSLRAELGAEIIFVHARLLGSAGLFDMSFMDDRYDESTWEDVQLVLPSPSKLHGLDDQSLVLHTSGTSGKKKVVPYSLRCLIVGTCCVAKSWDLSSKDVNMNMMPLFHVGGIIRNLWAPMFSGGSAIMCAGFDDLAFWPIVMERGATWYYAAPTMHHAILGSKPPSVVPATDTRIRMIANAAGGLLPTLAQQLKAAFGAVILPSYGMTECMPIASPPTNYKLDRPGCSGIACGPFMSIRDPFNLERELPCGATGAVSFRGLPTFEGYEKAIGEPLDTSSFSSEGWFDGGDVGFMDTDGYLFITGRSKEIINKGGEVISPFEIEEAITSLAKHRVKSTIAFSVEHDVLQETIGVVIVPIPGAPRIGLAELLDILKVQLHPSKWPFVIVYMDDLPKNNAGKPLRIKLASRLGISQMTDNTPAIMRYFEATAPDKNVPLSEPIPCSRVSPDVDELTHAVLEILGVQEVAVRLQKDGSPEALVSVTPMSELDVYSILYALTQAIPGYSMPDPLYVFQNLLERRSDDEVDWEYMETEIKRRNAFSMSSGAIAVRDIVAHLLDKDAGTIAGDSDFFLIGGNSLLLGRLAHRIRTEIGVTLKVSDIFTSSTINGISELIDAESSGTVLNKRASANSEKSAVHRCSVSVAGSEESWSTRGRPQTHLLVLIVQALPMMFFHPMKTTLTWTTLLYLLSRFSNFVSISYWERVGALLVAIICARLLARIVCPIAAIIFKWIVIGRYKPGVYRYWSNYHLRWWITNQFIRIAGRGIFSSHPKLEFLYFRALGAHIGENVRIDKSARLSELDLLTFKDGCRVDKAVVRGFCIERDGYFRLDPIIIGRNAAVNTYTQISPGAIVPDGAIYGPHASSHDEPSPDDYVTINRTENPEPHWLLKVFVAGPIIFVVLFASYLPWFAALFGLLTQTIPNNGLTNLESIIKWFASPSRIAWHTLARVNRELFPCIIQVALGIVVKRIMGFHREGSVEQMSQWTLLKRFINGTILSQDTLKGASDVLGAHYELTSWIWRGMGAKVGKRVYWPGSGLYCPDPELLEIGDNVVFGSRSEVFTTDSIGSAKVSVGSGSMIADRVVLMPGSTVGRKTIMGSGALGKRNGQYDDGSVWMGNDCGEAVCFGKPNKDTDEITTTPFGKAFYERNATFFVYPYWMLLVTNILVGGCSAAYWAMGPVVVTQILNQMRLHLRNLSLFERGARDIFVLFGLVATFFIITLTFMSLLVVIWVIATKWLVVGRRRDGRYDWDQSSYCQRWQLHLTLARPLHRGFDNGGILGAISGSAYYVWYLRALGAKIGKDCSMFSGGKVGLMTEPDLVQMGDNVALDDCSVVAHINSRGNFSLNGLKIGSGCALRAGSRLLSGASMDESSMLCEHTLLTSGETAVSGYAYAGWPARQVEAPLQRIVTEKSSRSARRSRGYSQVSRVARFSMLQPLPKPETMESEESSVQKEKEEDVIDMSIVSPLSSM
ncbi:putative peroxisomal-coenzyme A synthetase [Grifola frondosa]|uniref:Putative peroxisomal-coenzyme A synthetase n=1 Tax=Grifola frondosa TaxID=5627 RepID=A0A1C7MLS3_GRIFR|nr:putative peroxisomal-coenzyme A synthetase [Grifola frondosa]